MSFKVITAVTVEPVSLAEARLQIKADSDTTEDALITAWITAAREAAEHHTGLALAPQTLELALNAFPADTVTLEMPPVASVTHIKYTDTAGAEQTVDSADYALSPYGASREVSLTYDSEWPDTRDIRDAVRVRYVTGYGAPSAGAGFAACPKAAKAAILLMVAWLNENRGDAIQPDDIQPPAAKALLNTVKLWGF